MTLAVVALTVHVVAVTGSGSIHHCAVYFVLMDFHMQFVFFVQAAHTSLAKNAVAIDHVTLVAMVVVDVGPRNLLTTTLANNLGCVPSVGFEGCSGGMTGTHAGCPGLPNH